MATAELSRNDSISLFDELDKLPIYYPVLEGLVAMVASIGNLLVIIVFIQDKRLRKVTNFYIFSLALADLLVSAVGVPSAILTRMGLPRDAFHVCLTMLSLLLVCCTISILNLVAVSADRYWAILFPLNYHSNMSSRVATWVIVSCWIIGALIGFLPLFGVNNGPAASGRCLFIPIMSYDFLVFLYFATIIFPLALMALFYLRIYFVVVGQVRTVSQRVSSFKKDTLPEEAIKNGLRRSRTFPIPLLKATASQRQKRKLQSQQRRQCRNEVSENERSNFETSSSCSETTTSGSNSRRESIRKTGLSTVRDEDVKPIRMSYSGREVGKARKLFIIMLFFMLCWVPLYTLNAFEAFFRVGAPLGLLDSFIILSHVNSALNPILYAYHMKDFREAFRRLLCECVVRKQELRDRRRRELVSLSGVNVRKSGAAVLSGGGGLTKAMDRDLCVVGGSYPNSVLVTPELSPSISFADRSRPGHGLVSYP